MTKIIKVIILIIITGIFGFLVMLITPIYTLNSKELITNWDNQGKEVLDTGRKISNYQDGLNHEKYYSENYKNIEYFIKSIDILNPKIAQISERKSGTEIIHDIYKLKRTGIYTYELYDVNSTKFINKTFQEAIEIAKKYDLTKENPDPENIRVYPAPTREEVERQMKNEQLKSNPDRKARAKVCDKLAAQKVELFLAGQVLSPESLTLVDKIKECDANLEKDFPTIQENK